MGDKVEGGGVSKAGPTVINGSGAAGENSAQEAGVLSQSAAMEDSEPCTQPMPDEDLEDNDSHEDSVEIDQSQVFGYLIPLKPKGPMITLDQTEFNVGRSMHNNHVIKQEMMPKNFESISKFHFKIFKDTPSGAVYCEDRSSNGTFINGKRIGKGKKDLLSHNDILSMTGAKLKHFVYMTTNKDYLKMYPPELRDKYTVSRELGKGACGTVMLGIRKLDYAQVAIKIINKSKVSMVPGSSNGVMNEVKLLQAIDHPCVIRLEDVIETDSELYIILELADGGELFDKIIEKTKFQEQEAKLYFIQIVSAIEYLHAENICHRDLKPENILLCSDDDSNPVIKVTDLGLSKFVDVHTHLKTFCGTPQYLAPEVLFSRVRGDGSYDLKVDMWSLGVILYILLCGCPPFNPDRKDKVLIRQVTEADYKFPPSLWSSISKEAVDLVKKLMTLKPKDRLSATETLAHPWLDDAAVKRRAAELMDTQRKVQRARTLNPLEGILPPELELNSPNVGELATAAIQNPDEETSNVFKRPMEEKSLGGSACKRIKMN